MDTAWVDRRGGALVVVVRALGSEAAYPWDVALTLDGNAARAVEAHLREWNKIKGTWVLHGMQAGAWLVVRERTRGPFWVWTSSEWSAWVERAADARECMARL